MTIADAFDDHADLLARARAAIIDDCERVAEAVGAVLDRGGKVLAFGNGGSAGDAQHLATELVGRYEHDRPAWRAVALSADSALITAVANDLGFDAVFARQVDALADRGDIAVAISTSGRSPNVLAGVRAARAAGCTVVALTGGGGHELRALADLSIEVPSTSVARIQEVHGLVLHAIVAWLEARRTSAPPGGEPS